MQLHGLGGLGDALPSAILAVIASTIQNVEGYSPGTSSYIYNNPGNLVYVGQAKATAASTGVTDPVSGAYLPFAKFGSYQDGLNALYNQIQIYANEGLTITQMMQKYSPGDDPTNNPTSYAATIANALGVPPDTLLTNIQYGMGTPNLSLDYLTDSIDPTTLLLMGVVVLGVLVFYFRD
jgi:hypothetical protein